MDVERELERVTSYVRGVITGLSTDFDVIDRREIEALRKLPLSQFLEKLERSGLKIRGARGNQVEDILDLFETVRTQSEISKAALALRSGISRGHLSSLLRRRDPRPTFDTAVRLAVALDYPLVVIDAKAQPDDVKLPPRRRRPASTTAEETRPSEAPRIEPEPTSPLFWIVVTNGLSLVGGILLGGYLRTRKPAKRSSNR